MRHTTARFRFPVLAGTLAAALVSPAFSQTYTYDFNKGSTDWTLDASVWSLASSPGGTTGQALRGQGHGFAKLTAHKGAVSSLKFRVRLDGMNTYMHINVLEDASTSPASRYYLEIRGNGVKIVHQVKSNFEDLGVGFAPMGPNRFHDMEVYLGGGSLDVFVDGEAVVGVDTPAKLPDGTAGFESLVSSPVYVDDVTVEMGSLKPHPKAPRPPLSVAPGPNVGPFVKGVYTGDITLTNQKLILSNGRYTVKKGNILLQGASTLRIDPGAVLVFDRDDSPLIHWGVKLRESAALPQTSILEVAGGQLLATGGALLAIEASGKSQVVVSNARPWVHFINCSGNATVTLNNSRFVTGMGGVIGVSGSASLKAAKSRLGAVALWIAAKSRFRASNLPNGSIKKFDLRTDAGVWNIPLQVQLSQVEMEPDTLGAGPYERGWVLYIDETAMVKVDNSTLRKAVFGLGATGSSLAISGLKLNTPTKYLHVGDTDFNNVTVTGQWGFGISGARKATFENCQGLWLFLFDTADVTLRHSMMNEFDPRYYAGVLTFDSSQWIDSGEIITALPWKLTPNDFIMDGTVQMNDDVRQSLSWLKSTVTRRFPIQVVNASGKPVSGGTLTLTRTGSKPVTASISSSGNALAELKFTDADYKSPWVATSNQGSGSVELDFFTNTPVVLKLQ